MDERISSGKWIRIRKRDGSLEPFSVAKIAGAIRSGMTATGDTAGLDLVGVRGLAEAVQDYLLQTADDEPVRTARIAELIELVLVQTGHSAAAMAIRQYARELERERRQLLVATARKTDGRFVQRRWKKAHLVQHLRHKHLLDAPASRMIAGRVEQLVLSSGLRVVTAGLVTEMARSELLAWGLLPGALVTKRRGKQRRGQAVQDNMDRA